MFLPIVDDFASDFGATKSAEFQLALGKVIDELRAIEDLSSLRTKD